MTIFEIKLVRFNKLEREMIFIESELNWIFSTEKCRFQPNSDVFDREMTFLIDNDIIYQKILNEKWLFYRKMTNFDRKTASWTEKWFISTEKWRILIENDIIYQKIAYFDRDMTFLTEKWPILT